MTTRSAFVATAASLLLATTLTAQNNDAAASSSGVSKVRIVRLSEAKGQVELDRNNGRGYEPGITNLPIVENSKLKTGEGVAEVEFEDNSSLRVAPNSIVEFPQLERMASGGTASTVHLVQGMAYVSLVKSNNNQFNLAFGDQNLPLPAPSHIRLQLSGTEARLAVLDGNLHLAEATGTTIDVPKKKTVTFDLMQHQQPEVGKNIAPEPYDEWDHTATDYHSRVANISSFNGSPYSYGINDLAYYGNFVGGCGGSMWRPYFASAAWDPYSNGAWAYYQGAGYSWVSPYPWGWMPYHYGSWSFCPGTGWGWMPGGMWNGLNNIAMMSPNNGNVIGGGVNNRRLPVVPIKPPTGRQPSMLAVNSKPLVRSELTNRESFSFRQDSAGMGIPRGDFGKLNKFSEQVQHHGMVNQQIYLNAPAQTMPGGRPTNTSVLAGSLHRGSAPAPPSASMGSPGSAASRGPSGGGSSNGGCSGRSAGPSPSPAPVAAPAPSSGGRPR